MTQARRSPRGGGARLTKQKPNMEYIERRISAATSLSLCGLTVLAQIAISLLVPILLQEKASVVYALFWVIGAILAIRVYQRSGSPSYKLVWMCLLLAMPVSGTMLFYFWGGTQQAKSLSLRKIPPILCRESQRMDSDASLSRLRKQSPAWGRLAAYLQKRGFLLYRNTAAKYFSEGADFFEDFIVHLQSAETYIFLEYYILAEGTLWDRIFSVLQERAAAGVEVFITFDDFGNLTRFSDEALRAVQDAGIEVKVFNPVHRYLSRINFNYRDHRKIAVIDGQFAYTGGINIADEYANLIVRFGYWKDSAVRIEGEGVWGFATQFMQMWKMMGGSFPNEDDYYRPRHDPPVSAGYCQPFTDGPLNNPDNPIEEVYLQLIGSAQRMLYITTPYYAVEESMQKALCMCGCASPVFRTIINLPTWSRRPTGESC